MQKVITAILSIFLVLALVGIVSAENDTSVIENSTENQDNEMEAGAKPGSIFYGLDRAMERVRMSFIFSKEKKAEYGFKIAEERLAEARELSEKGKDDKAEIAVRNHGRAMEEVQKNIEKIDGNGNNKTSKKTLNASYSLEERLQKHRQKVTQVHSRILNRLGSEGNMSSEQVQHLEQVFGKIENHSLEVEGKILQKRENARMRYKVLSNKSEEEIDEEFAQQRNKVQKAKESQEKREEAFENAQKARSMSNRAEESEDNEESKDEEDSEDKEESGNAVTKSPGQKKA